MSNSFGSLFKITTWGESHGRALGVVIDGCPAGLPLTEEDIQKELDRRQPGNSPYTSPRKEADHAEIFSGLFEGRTTGAPISIVIFNHNAQSTAYHPIQDKLRPGHANFTYLAKYGIYDHRGGGRASARETVCRVAAGAVAKKLLTHFEIQLAAYILEIGGHPLPSPPSLNMRALQHQIAQSPLFCPDPEATQQMIQLIEAAQKEGDSLGGIVEFITTSLPQGLGNPIYEKLEANLAKAMLSLPATKGFEIGSGFRAARLRGSEHNDLFILNADRQVATLTNQAGGVLGGISTGMPLIGRVAFKPTSSIQKEQPTLSLSGEITTLTLPEGSRHDPCVAIRAVPVVEAMAALVLADALLLHRSSTL